MDVKQLLVAGTAVLASFVPGLSRAQKPPEPYVQVAEIDIDPGQLDAYKAAVAEHIETAVRVEPGVLTLYAVADKDRPAHVRVFEVYRDIDAYRSHLETAHFKKYKTRLRRWSRR